MINKNDRILITGCGGMLGAAVYHQFKDICQVLATDIDMNSPWLSFLDVRYSKSINNILSVFKPTHLINLAALTDLEYCELNIANAYETNAWGVHNLILKIKELNIPFIQ